MISARLAALISLLVVAASQHSTPPVTTAVQHMVLSEQSRKAKLASEAATPQVLAFFDAPDFRSELKSCCRQVAQLSSQELLQRLRAEMKAAELAHSFPASDDGHHDYDMTIARVQENSFWLNEWLGPLKYGAPLPQDFNPAEEGLFGLPPFKNDSTPTWQEAADRLIYIVQNLRQLDFGSRPNFGQASVIFNKSYVKDNVLIAAVDTGLWERTCNKSFPSPRPEPINCSSWFPHQVGTLDHADHLILPNIASWKSSTETLAQAAGRLIARTPLAGNYSALKPFSLSDNNRYLEANILMNPSFPEGIQMVIGDFAALFGTDLGVSLQQVAQQRGWPIAWSRGFLGVDTHHHSTLQNVPGNGRVLDPTVISGRQFNASFPATAQADFDKLWSSVKDARASGKPASSQWEAWWNSLALQQLRVAPVSAYACSAPVSCVAVDAGSGHCICHHEPSALVV